MRMDKSLLVTGREQARRARRARNNKVLLVLVFLVLLVLDAMLLVPLQGSATYLMKPTASATGQITSIDYVEDVQFMTYGVNRDYQSVVVAYADFMYEDVSYTHVPVRVFRVASAAKDYHVGNTVDVTFFADDAESVICVSAPELVVLGILLMTCICIQGLIVTHALHEYNQRQLSDAVLGTA